MKTNRFLSAMAAMLLVCASPAGAASAQGDTIPAAKLLTAKQAEKLNKKMTKQAEKIAKMQSIVITIYMLPDWVTCKIGALSIQRTVVTSRHL